MRNPGDPGGKQTGGEKDPLLISDVESDLFVGVRLDLTPLNSHVVLKLPGCRGKGISQGHVNILVLLLVVMITTDHDVLVRHIDINPNLPEIAVMLVMVLSLYSNAATGDVVAMLLKLSRLFPNTSLNSIRVLDTMKSDF